VIGGGYATGRELVEFFFPSVPDGGLAGIALTMLLWSAVCADIVAAAYAARNHALSERARLAIAVAMMVVAIFVATRFGRVTLIAVCRPMCFCSCTSFLCAR
jgi:uncharacterized membrane protein YkvI